MMTEQTTTLTPAQLRANELAAKRVAKAAAKEAQKAANLAKRQDGVIGTLRAALGFPEGVTKREILDTLTDKFPERDPIGMSTTVGIQLSRLQKQYGKIVSRKQPNRIGLVYGFETTVRFVEEGSAGVVPMADLVAKATEQYVEARTEKADPIVHVDAFADGYLVTHASGAETEVLIDPTEAEILADIERDEVEIAAVTDRVRKGGKKRR